MPFADQSTPALPGFFNFFNKPAQPPMEMCLCGSDWKHGHRNHKLAWGKLDLVDENNLHVDFWSTELINPKLAHHKDYKSPCPISQFIINALEDIEDYHNLAREF